MEPLLIEIIYGSGKGIELCGVKARGEKLRRSQNFDIQDLELSPPSHNLILYSMCDVRINVDPCSNPLDACRLYAGYTYLSGWYLVSLK